MRCLLFPHVQSSLTKANNGIQVIDFALVVTDAAEEVGRGGAVDAVFVVLAAKLPPANLGAEDCQVGLVAEIDDIGAFVPLLIVVFVEDDDD